MVEEKLYPLSEKWIPNKLLIRDRQLNALIENYKSPFPCNYWIYGDKGLGKTLTIKIFSQMFNHTYVVSCINQLFKKSIELFALKYGIIPKSRDDAISILVKTILSTSEEGSKISIFFDDVDKLGRYFKRDFSLYVHDLYDRLQQYDYTFSINVVTTTPYNKVESILSPPAQSRLKFKPLHFPRYTKNEVATILKQRVEYINGLKVEEEAIHEIADKVSRIGGDIRKALELARSAILMSGNLTLTSVEKAWQKEKEEFWMEQILSLPYHQALLLGCIVEETVKIHQTREADPPYLPVYWNSVKTRYRRRCSDFKVLPQGEKMLYHWLEHLWQKNWIEKFILSKDHEWNYARKRGLYIRLLEKISNLIPVIQKINWSEPW